MISCLSLIHIIQNVTGAQYTSIRSYTSRIILQKADCTESERNKKKTVRMKKQRFCDQIRSLNLYALC